MTKRFFLIALALIVSACQSGPGGETPTLEANPTPAEAEVAAIPPEALAPELEPEPLPDPAQFMGLSPADTQLMMGAPNFERREGPAAIHQYALGDCVLDLVFYEQSAGDALVLTHLDARDPGGDSADLPLCLQTALASAEARR